MRMDSHDCRCRQQAPHQRQRRLRRSTLDKSMPGLPETVQDIEQATRRNATLGKVYKYVQQGWPKQVSEELLLHSNRETELSTENRCLLWGIQVIVPRSLQSWVLQSLHANHPGVSRTMIISHSHFWWKGLDKDIETMGEDMSFLPSQSMQSSNCASPSMGLARFTMETHTRWFCSPILWTNVLRDCRRSFLMDWSRNDDFSNFQQDHWGAKITVSAQWASRTTGVWERTPIYSTSEEFWEIPERKPGQGHTHGTISPSLQWPGRNVCSDAEAFPEASSGDGRSVCHRLAGVLARVPSNSTCYNRSFTRRTLPETDHCVLALILCSQMQRSRWCQSKPSRKHSMTSMPSLVPWFLEQLYWLVTTVVQISGYLALNCKGSAMDEIVKRYIDQLKPRGEAKTPPDVSLENPTILDNQHYPIEGAVQVTPDTKQVSSATLPLTSPSASWSIMIWLPLIRGTLQLHVWTREEM